MAESKIAQFRREQNLREQAAKEALSGLAVVAAHEVITKRMEGGANHILQLVQEGKHEEAQALFDSNWWD